mmetsp:Transcript_57903/g.124575  ORF Transcript_57903/g.124575 Transcript_57903/m.124575 type:complete len:244 (+) Transcript_57903:206-937(+)
MQQDQANRTNLAGLRSLAFGVEGQSGEHSGVDTEGPADDVAVGADLAQVEPLNELGRCPHNIPHPVLPLLRRSLIILLRGAVPLHEGHHLPHQVNEPGDGDHLQSLQDDGKRLTLQHLDRSQPGVVIQPQEHRGQRLVRRVEVVPSHQRLLGRRDGHHFLAETPGALRVHQSTEESGQLGVALGGLGQATRGMQPQHQPARVVPRPHQRQPSVGLGQPLPDHRGARGLQVLREERHGTWTRGK